ncbi:SpoIIE family protein phosphatase [Streptomyces sp. 7-21]|uniref:SpoIIE family protein phosphatase n=1 Tax=Streptomyces sp. 7-21 TaxID=2802283 RepID=UPI00192003EC|nr:SpoIIE family protein phosphatase [Streptomyces sp. 7-21]MBL1068843.1 SpoIIE family protein phosphatase [Streptomyces sp. 7-21]
MRRRKAAAAPPAAPVPDDWPVGASVSLAMNRMGCFDWDLDRDRLHMDRTGLDLYRMAPEDFEGRPDSLRRRIPDAEWARLNALVTRAIRQGEQGYGAYFRIQSEGGELRWTHTQGRILRDGEGRARRIIGIVRDASAELGRTTAQPPPGTTPEHRASVVEEAVGALAAARTVREVTDVLASPRGLGRLRAVTVLLGVAQGSRLRVVPATPGGLDIRPLQHARIEDNLPLSEAVRLQTPVFVSSRDELVTRYPDLLPYVGSLRIGASVYLPLVAQARPLGGLGIMFPDDRPFPPAERNLFVALGGVVAQSLQRALLLEQEHDLAENLQHAMLPRRIPEAPGVRIAVRYRSAGMGRQIGGDWYDVIPLPDGRLAAAVGDVQGHDPHATAVMGQLRTVVRAYASEGHPATRVLAQAAGFLGDLETERFATCLYAEFDPATGRLLLVRAGHLEPLLLRADGGAAPLPVPGDLPLGMPVMGVPAEYPVTDTVLRPGETLLMCTDGLVERHGGDMDEGIARVTQAMQAGPADLESLADLVCDTSGVDGPTEDDVAVLLLRREAPG